MKGLHACFIFAVVVSTGCRGTSQSVPAPSPSAPASAPAPADSIVQGARGFLRDVAEGVTRDGPIAWKRYFSAAPEFYMVSEGQLVFDGGEAAGRGIDELTRVIERIELRWGEPIRVDPLTGTKVLLSAAYFERIVPRSGPAIDEQGWMTGVAERGPKGWRFVNLHWSVLPSHDPAAPDRPTDGE